MAAGGTGRAPARSLNCVGMLCPLPIIELGKAADGLPAGAEIVVRADDPAARADVAAWCRMRGHALVSVGTDDDGVSTFVVRLR